jgi:hypothetical protein
MADITVTAARIAVVFPDSAEIYPAVAGVTITAGAACYFDSSGNLALSDASATATSPVHGLALESAGAGQETSLLVRGHVYGFTLAGAYGASAYLSDTDSGKLADAAGTQSAVVGKIVPLSDPSRTKVLYFKATNL